MRLASRRASQKDKAAMRAWSAHQAARIRVKMEREQVKQNALAVRKADEYGRHLLKILFCKGLFHFLESLDQVKMVIIVSRNRGEFLRWMYECVIDPRAQTILLTRVLEKELETVRKSFLKEPLFFREGILNLFVPPGTQFQTLQWVRFVQNHMYNGVHLTNEETNQMIVRLFRSYDDTIFDSGYHASKVKWKQMVDNFIARIPYPHPRNEKLSLLLWVLFWVVKERFDINE